MINIKGMNKAEVLKALYDHSHVQGYGFLQAVPKGLVTIEHCEELLEQSTYFDYLYGRVLKVDLSGDEFDERLYDRDCGHGAAARAVRSIKKSGKSSFLNILLEDGMYAMISDGIFSEAGELRLRFDSVSDIDKMIDMLKHHRHSVAGGDS